jgi:hypothetical protein
MTSLSPEARAAADQNFAEKMAARKDGRAAVLVTPAAGTSASSQEMIDARFRAKMANHGKPVAAPKAEKPKAEPTPASDAKPKAEKPKG